MNKTTATAATYPDCYLHITECRSGQEWIVPIRPRQTLNLETRIRDWIRREFGGEFILDPPLLPKLDGDYYAKILTDGRPPDSIVVWTAAGFYVKPAPGAA